MKMRYGILFCKLTKNKVVNITILFFYFCIFEENVGASADILLQP